MKKIIICLTVLLACQSQKTKETIDKFSPVGTWILVSRIDKTNNDATIVEPTLGSDPIAILNYDTLGNVAVQIMKRNRQDTSFMNSTVDPNNTTSMNGYDAYFGKYTIDYSKKQITHHILATLDLKNLNKDIIRNFDYSNDTLRLSFKALNQQFSVTRTLTWVRAK